MYARVSTRVPGWSLAGSFDGREAYARVTTPETSVRASRSGFEFSTGVEKTVENRGFLISQA
jgi:hypothetical protein